MGLFKFIKIITVYFSVLSLMSCSTQHVITQQTPEIYFDSVTSSRAPANVTRDLDYYLAVDRFHYYLGEFINFHRDKASFEVVNALKKISPKMILAQDFSFSQISDANKFDELIHRLLDRKFPDVPYSKQDLVWNYNFLKRKYDILVSTTIIEVGIDFPNANVIIIENSNKFGLSQLHQLRGRVGRGNKQSTCILMFKSTLTENAKKRLNILKNTNDGFKISEEDLKIRGYGDILGLKQSGLKTFKLADPILNENLFILAEKEIKRIENNNEDISKFKTLMKLYDQADIINDIV